MTPIDWYPDGVVVLDETTCVASLNAEAAALLGRPVDEIVGRTLAEVARPRSVSGADLLTTGWHPSARLGSVRGLPEHNVVVDTPAGERSLRVTGRYQRDGSGRVSGAVLSLRPAQRRHLDGEPTGVEVVSTVSHELRSPLTSVKGYTSLLLNRWDRLSDDQKRMMLEQIHHDADRVTRLIGELLDISRLETGRLVLRRELVDLVALARRVLEKLTIAYPELEGELVGDLAAPKVYADPDKIEQVLTNLIENAMKYASPTGLELRFEPLDDSVAVAVSDRGEGIPAVDLPNVFRKFFRRDHGKPTGTGLGLWISRGLVEAHGGQLEAESDVGVGSTFRFTVPMATPEWAGEQR
jgi:signal transduction histidine kinase